MDQDFIRVEVNRATEVYLQELRQARDLTQDAIGLCAFGGPRLKETARFHEQRLMHLEAMIKAIGDYLSDGGLVSAEDWAEAQEGAPFLILEQQKLTEG